MFLLRLFCSLGTVILLLCCGSGADPEVSIICLCCAGSPYSGWVGMIKDWMGAWVSIIMGYGCLISDKIGGNSSILYMYIFICKNKYINTNMHNLYDSLLA